MLLGVVVPCYNEQEVLPETIAQITAFLHTLVTRGKIAPDSRIYFVDDGSRDRTWQLIVEASRRDATVKGLRLSRNRGHQNALLAGLLTAEGDALISLDADLQDDIHVIEDMVDAFANGNHVVYGVRRTRAQDTFFKRATARAFYRLMTLMGVETVYDHADYRLLSRAAINGLREFNEINMFLRGLVPLIGYQSTTVHYDRHSRFAGESKYPLRKMIAFALEGITSFSTVPLRFITLFGLSIAFGTILMSGWILLVKLINEQAVPGWASTVLPIYFLGGVQLLSIGVIGEYLGKVYTEVKHRPRFIIQETC